LTQQYAARDVNRPVQQAADRPRGSSASDARLAQLAATLDTSPRTQALVQLKSALQKSATPHVVPGAQPVIQRKTEIDYKTQQVAYQDALGQAHGEDVGRVADAWIDVADPIKGAEPDSQKQQKPMYDRLKAVYGTGPFIRGHLLNGNMGGVGEVYNLFPITSHANSEHKRTAEGRLKKHVRTEQQALASKSGGPYFVHYRVTAVPANGGNLTANADAQFLCEMVSAHDHLPGGENEVWTVPSNPGTKVTAIGDRSEAKDYANTGLGSFGSDGRGESAGTLGSRMRSTVNGWRGDQNHKFAATGLGSHVSLATAKEKYLAQIEDELDKDPLYEDIFAEVVDKAEELFAAAYDMPALDKALQQIRTDVLAWTCKMRKQQLLDSLKSSLMAVAIPDAAKHQIYQSVEQHIAPITDLAAFQQGVGALVTAVTQHVQQLLQQQAST
jgi:hypothetical protein